MWFPSQILIPPSLPVDNFFLFIFKHLKWNIFYIRVISLGAAHLRPLLLNISIPQALSRLEPGTKFKMTFQYLFGPGSTPPPSCNIPKVNCNLAHHYFYFLEGLLRFWNLRDFQQVFCIKQNPWISALGYLYMEMF